MTPALGGGAGQGPAAFLQSPVVQGDIPTAQWDDSSLTFTHSLGLISEMRGAPALSQGLEVLLEVPLRVLRGAVILSPGEGGGRSPEITVRGRQCSQPLRWALQLPGRDGDDQGSLPPGDE